MIIKASCGHYIDDNCKCPLPTKQEENNMPPTKEATHTPKTEYQRYKDSMVKQGFIPLTYSEYSDLDKQEAILKTAYRSISHD